ncbi:methyltransferase family protein [Prauserella shujinwangii]|uniref:Methyltransferase family protein n=1 Tax=Prauserella shujinwangii TaxID=1453103 RepID=A0A2T0LKS6_9PSEU|nr:class I SAM-dependent methyltransferase [Prauserella shujinwangii]PRX43557.1 methyltransferase family protein [Prauserella shujinwangii]
MRRLDQLEREPLAAVAARLTADLPDAATVVDIGSGSGGMSAALAAALRGRGGGTLVLVDAVDELLAAARESALAEAGADVRVETVVADAATAELPELLPRADLVWGSAVVHHLPDQQAAVNRFAEMLRPGGLLAVAEGGLETSCLPWDVGVGTPGLEQRLNAARNAWFGELRAGMPEAVRMPHGWTTALRRAGLVGTSSFTYLIDHPAPGGPLVQEFAAERLGWLAEIAEDRVSAEDSDAARRLLDPEAPEYLGHRDDVFVLSARTVHYGHRT